MTKRFRLLAGVVAAGCLIGGVSAFAAVDSGRRWLKSNLRPDVFKQAMWCWESEGAKSKVAESESRRDTFVVRTALLGAAAPDPKARATGDVRSWTGRIDRDASRLGFVYAYFWSPADRKRIFDQAAAARPVCSSSFGPDAGKPVNR